MSGFAFHRLSRVFGAEVVHEEAKGSATLSHDFGSEDFLRGHFPGFPVVPGVILLDGMTLAAAHLFERLTGLVGNDIDRIAIDSAAFHRPVLPGMAADFSARADPARGAGQDFSVKCSVTIGRTRHARASMTFHIHGDQASPAI